MSKVIRCMSRFLLTMLSVAWHVFWSMFWALLFAAVISGVTLTGSKSIQFLFAPQLNDYYTLRTVPLMETYTAVDPSYAQSKARDGGSYAVLSIVVNALRPEDRTATLTIQGALGDQVERNLVDIFTGEPILDPDPDVAIVKPKYADLKAFVQVDGGDPAFEVSVPVTLRDLIQPNYNASSSEFPFDTTTEVVNLPVTWQQQRYPADALSPSTVVNLLLPFEVEPLARYTCVKQGKTHCPSSVPPLAIQVKSWNASAFVGWQGRVNQDVLSAPLSVDPGFVSLELIFTREPFLVFYTIGIALVPSVLFLLLFYTVWLRRKAAVNDPPETLQSFILSLAVTMLTVVPLRAVLVPPRITSVTTVDMILGAELLLLLGLGVGQHTFRQFVRSRHYLNHIVPIRELTSSEDDAQPQEADVRVEATVEVDLRQQFSDAACVFVRAFNSRHIDTDVESDAGCFSHARLPGVLYVMGRGMCQDMAL